MSEIRDAVLNDPKFQCTLMRAKIEEAEDWRGAVQKIPYMTFPVDWEVKIIPPVTMAMVRFWVRLLGKEDKHVSIYLDWHEKLGFFGGQPYWEAYPIGDDTARFALNDTEGLIKAIDEELRK